VALHDGDRLVVRPADRPQSAAGDLVGQRLGPDDQHLGLGRQLVGQQSGGALCAGDDVVGGGTESEFGQVRGDVTGCAGRIVGDVEDSRLERREGVDGPGGRLVSTEDGAVEIEQQAVMLRSNACHNRLSSAR
jgi:hypothetical protein